jgi:hypothetical protein
MKMIIGILIGLYIGWTYAHFTVADECEKLGKFYVGKRIFECTKITDNREPAE